MKKDELIVSAAMLMQDNTIVMGVRHFSPDMRIILKRMYGDKYHLQVAEQGFITNMGRFLNRQDAWKLAEQTNQIKYQVSVSGDLYSENLY